MMLKAALEYAKMGWYVFPIKEKSKIPLTSNGFKDATTDPAIIRSWWEKWPNANIGVDCGRSNLAVIDLDKKPDYNGKSAWERLVKKHAIDDMTLTSNTGSGGLHLIFAMPSIPIRNSAGKISKGIDTRGIGGYIVVPPSIHPNGNPYKWDYTLKPPTKPKDFPRALADLLNKKDKARSNSKGDIPEGQRESELCKQAGAMRRKGMSPEAIEAALLIENRSRCNPPLDENDIHRIAQSIGSYAPESKPDKPSFPLTDLGNAERLVSLHGRNIRYCHITKEWHIWNGKVWQPDNKAEIRKLAQQHVKQIVHEEVDREKLGLRQIASLQSHTRLNGMIEEVKPLISIFPSDFDRYPMLINCENGIIDISTRELLPHDPYKLLSKKMPVVYDPDAKPDLWLKFLNDIMLGDEELIAFLQRLVGYSLTGDISEQCFIILYGSGENGKSTFLNTIMTMMGGYALTTPPEGIMIKKYGTGIPIEMARLPGIRLTSVSETESGQRLAESLLKQFTGGEEITARPLYGQLFSFKPIAKIWIQTNHKPDIRGRDHAIWRRVILIPFNFKVKASDKDQHLMDKLIKELPAILNWGLDGYERWQDYGLMVPNKVKAAVEDYREESDILGNFLSETCEEDADGFVKGSDIRQHYKDWCEVNKEDVLSPQRFSKMLSERYRKAKDGSGNSRYYGIKLKSMEKSLFGKTEDVRNAETV